MSIINQNIPRPEYPRPQMVRQEWLNLNGTWDFEFDPGDSGLERGLLETPLSDSITVPFVPESEMSGIGDASKSPQNGATNISSSILAQLITIQPYG